VIGGYRFKRRSGFSMRVPENLPTNQAADSTIQNLEDFYDLNTTFSWGGT
jgi:hypothetical protein